MWSSIILLKSNSYDHKKNIDYDYRATLCKALVHSTLLSKVYIQAVRRPSSFDYLYTLNRSYDIGVTI